MNKIGFFRLTEVLKIFPICRSAWFKGIREGKYPAPIKHGASSFWRKTDIYDLVRRTEGNGKDEKTLEQ